MSIHIIHQIGYMLPYEEFISRHGIGDECLADWLDDRFGDDLNITYTGDDLVTRLVWKEKPIVVGSLSRYIRTVGSGDNKDFVSFVPTVEEADSWYRFGDSIDIELCYRNGEPEEDIALLSRNPRPYGLASGIPDPLLFWAQELGILDGSLLEQLRPCGL